MAAATESIQTINQAFRSQSLKKPVSLTVRDCRLRVDGDGGVRNLDSLSERRALFGRGQLYFYKIQAGVIVPAPRPEWSCRLFPDSFSITGRLFGSVDVVQSFCAAPSDAIGYVRRVSVRNAGASRITLRLVSLSDPAAAHFGSGPFKWGSLGMEAFNREGHVALDEVSDSRLARVVGAVPSPSRFFMTTDKGRASEILQEGSLPDRTTGMSGQVLILTVHEFELSPSESKDILFASVYSTRRIDDAVSAYEKLKQGGTASRMPEPQVVCSTSGVSEAFAWAQSAVKGAVLERDVLERLEAMPGLEYTAPSSAESAIQRIRELANKKGLLGHAQDPSKPDILATSLFLSAFSRHLAFLGDKKAAKRPYTALRKTSDALQGMAKDGAMRPEPGPAQGWRRLIMTGYPAWEVPEVSLAAAEALNDLGAVSVLLGKGEDAAALRERAELVIEGVVRRLRDSKGFLCSGVDELGKPRLGETIDMAVACYRNPSIRSVASAAVHRLLEEDFQTEYGPRTVPTSNRTYFHSSYGQGQLGGFWTRAALAMACLSYDVALPGVGSLLIEKASKLVVEDALKLGGVPGEFPYWVDIEEKEAHGDGSDPVAASRFIQAVVEGELGFGLVRGEPSFDPPALSTISWILAKDLMVGSRVTVFVGRSAGKAATFACGQRGALRAAEKFGSWEEAIASPGGAHAVSFCGPGQVLCVGNSTAQPLRAHVTFAGRAPGLTRKLSTPLEEYDPDRGAWSKIGSLRVSPQMAFDAPLGPCEWRAYRVSND